MDDAGALVEAFIADYFRWNHDAHQRREQCGGSTEAQLHSTTIAEGEYAAMLRRYCLPGFAGQPISYGTPAFHDPACETVMDVSQKGDRCLVKTRMVSDMAGVEITEDFEYVLSHANGRWYLESVCLVAEDGKYVSL